MNAITPPLTLKEKQRKERETLILQATEEVLLEKGYHALSMDEIAARVGIAKGTLYLHFASKDDLIFQLLERDLRRVLRTIEDTPTIEETPGTRLRFILVSLYQDFFSKHGQLLFTLYNSREIKAVLQEKLSEAFHQMAGRVTTLLDEGKATGVFDPAIPTEVMMSIFFSMLSPRAYQHLVLEKKMLAEDLVRYVESIYFRGIAAQPPASSAV